MAATTDISNPIFARLWDRVMSKESRRMHELRRELLASLSGTVVELGPGNGTNFALYPQSVQEVVAVEPEPYLRRQAESAAADAQAPVRVVDGRAEAIPVDDGSADAVVSTLVLCSVEDQPGTLAEIRRVLRPGGELRLLEHVGAVNPAGQAFLRMIEVTFWRRSFGNCQPTRHTLAALDEAGFDTSDIRRHTPRTDMPLPHIVGVAHTA
jgi:ubiquinone/menaquinone biosynthesis C-methylase UbiE